MSRLPKAVFVADLLLVWLAVPACTPGGGPDPDLQEEVADLQGRTIPPGSTITGRHAPTLQGWVATAEWEFLSTYSDDTYNRWVAGRLRPDFQIDGSAGSAARFVRYTHGDVETLSVESSASGGKLRVAVKLEAYPD